MIERPLEMRRTSGSEIDTFARFDRLFLLSYLVRPTMGTATLLMKKTPARCRRYQSRRDDLADMGRSVLRPYVEIMFKRGLLQAI
jgi:hypothetical protein